MKDIIDTCDMPTEYGSPIYAGHRPRAVDARLACSKPPARHHGEDRDVRAWPSTWRAELQSARARSHARRLVERVGGCGRRCHGAARAGDTDGRLDDRPAAYCGVVGYKPSLGLLPRRGILEQSSLLDQPGVIARDVADAALLVEAIAGEERGRRADLWLPAIRAPACRDAG